MELNGWTSPQMLTRYGASARGARARRSYDRIMDDSTSPAMQDITRQHRIYGASLGHGHHAASATAQCRIPCL